MTTLGRHRDDIRTTIGRQLDDNWTTIGRHSDDFRTTYRRWRRGSRGPLKAPHLGSPSKGSTAVLEIAHAL